MSKIASTYEKPAIRRYGSLEEMTRAGAIGTTLDADFPAGTPFSGLTFS